MSDSSTAAVAVGRCGGSAGTAGGQRHGVVAAGDDVGLGLASLPHHAGDHGEHHRDAHGEGQHRRAASPAHDSWSHGGRFILSPLPRHENQASVMKPV